MRKRIFNLLAVSSFFLFFSCRTLPIEKSYDKLNRTFITLNEPVLKIYFPQFGLYNDEQTKENIIGGDGIVIILPDEKCIVIDSFDPEASYDMVCFLEKLGIRKIDYLIASHYHADHVGSMPGLIKYFDIGKFYSNGADFSTKACFLLIDALYEKNLEINVLKQGDILNLLTDDDCKIEVLWPKEFTKKELDEIYWRPGSTQKLRNNTSLVFKFNYKDFSVMFTGDIYKDCDKIITKQYGSKLKSTILKVPHHGEFYTANSPEFVKTVAADYGVIENPYYMINSIITGIYKKAKTPLLYRKTPGYILIESDGINYNISQESFVSSLE